MGRMPKDNDLDLTSFGSAQAIIAKPKVLGDVAERLRLGDMPPKDAPQPSQAEREQLLGWITAALDAEAAARAGDPGPVTLRRLSNAEYDNAIRDLTGVDMRPTRAREFPTDSVGGEGFANVGDAMPVTPELVERYHQAARDVAARAVLLPTGFRFSPSTGRPDWTEEALKSLRSFHARYAGPNGEPPLAAHLAATLKHRDRLTRGGPADIAAVAAEEKLNATYLAALWAGLSGKSASPAEVDALTKQWQEKAAQVEAEKQRRQTAFQSAKQKIESQLGLVETCPRGVQSRGRGLCSLRAQGLGSTRRTAPLDRASERKLRGRQHARRMDDPRNNRRSANLERRRSGAQSAEGEPLVGQARGPLELPGNDIHSGVPHRTARQQRRAARTEIVEPRFRTLGLRELRCRTICRSGRQLPARSFFVHPGQKRPVAVAWTSPIAGELLVAGRVADAHPAGGDGVSFELSHVAAPDLGQALADLGSAPTSLPDAGLPPDMLALVREKWRAATTDPAPVLAAIKAMQDQLFQGNYGKNAAMAVGNGFPAWEDLRRVVARERVQGAAREPLFRMVALPAQPDTFVVWDRLRLEGGDGPPLVFAEHPELGAAVEQASGLKFGQHPQGRPVPKSALVTAAGAEIVIDLKKLPAELQKALTLPRFLRADVSLDEASPETASVQAFLIAATGGGGRLAEPVAKATPGDPLAAQIVHPRVAAERARPAAEFRALFPPAVLFQPIIPRDAQGSVFLYRREDEPLRRLLLDDAGRAEIDRLWSELEFVSEQALATPIAYEGLVQYYRKPNDGRGSCSSTSNCSRNRSDGRRRPSSRLRSLRNRGTSRRCSLSPLEPGAVRSPPTNARRFSRPTAPTVPTACQARSGVPRRTGPRPLVAVVPVSGRTTGDRAALAAGLGRRTGDAAELPPLGFDPR